MVVPTRGSPAGRWPTSSRAPTSSARAPIAVIPGPTGPRRRIPDGPTRARHLRVYLRCTHPGVECGTRMQVAAPRGPPSRAAGWRIAGAGCDSSRRRSGVSVSWRNPDPVQPSWDPDAMDCSTLAPVPIDAPVPSMTATGRALLPDARVGRRRPGVENLRGVLWLQGECDASAGVAHEAYEMALEEFADAIWQDLGVPLIVAPISRRRSSTDSCQGHPEDRHHQRSDAGSGSGASRGSSSARGSTISLSRPTVPTSTTWSTLGERWYDAVSTVLPACNDGLDNDGDGLVDVGEDIGCPGTHGQPGEPDLPGRHRQRRRWTHRFRRRSGGEWRGAPRRPRPAVRDPEQWRARRHSRAGSAWS